LLAAAGFSPGVLAGDSNPDLPTMLIVQAQGRVKLMPAGSTTWVLTQTNQPLHVGDRLRTDTQSRVVIQWSDLSVVRLGPLTEMLVLAPDHPDSLPGLQILKGVLSFFHRETPGRIRILSRGATAGVKGTELVMAVSETNSTERVVLSVIDGVVEFANAQGALQLTNRQQAVAEPGRPPMRTAGFTANNLLQWCFYYPAVLDLGDLSLTPDETEALAASLAAYRSGDLLRALATYPANRLPASDAERLYHAALLLSVGEVAQTEVELDALSANVQKERLAAALRTLIAAVKRSPRSTEVSPELATELLAESYYQQSRSTDEEALKSALQLARRATVVSPQFGFAWERVAELEFGFGHIQEATRALDRSLEVSPLNAEALALKGFLSAASGDIAAATKWFDRAIRTDAALGNAWLGRGLCRIRQGDAEGGRADLLIAAAQEPQRALLRSYLGKAYANAGDIARASHELGLSKQLDPADPTPWLYSALLLNNDYRTADAIHDLERSQQLNENRAVYRSRLLLDQDQAVRSANLASIFEDAGMRDVSARESARAVSFDYANFSSHLNLASSYNQLRDPTRFNLRFESQWFNEHLLASLLAPVGAGSLSQNLSQQEYSQLFAEKRFGLKSTTEYFGDGEWRQAASQFGTLGQTSYALDLEHQHKDGGRVNNDLDRIEWYTRIKQQLGQQDSVLLLVKYQDYEAGDNFQYYDPDASARPDFRVTETQTPLLLAGWHHEWSPGVHTLFLGGRRIIKKQMSDRGVNQLAAIVNPPNFFDPTNVVPFDVRYRSEFETYTAEFNQIFQRVRHTDILGARFQSGSFTSSASLDNPPPGLASLFTLPVNSATDSSFRRGSLYAYHHWELVDNLMLIGGLAYDVLDYPANFRRPSLESSESHKEHWSPKAAMIWDLSPRVRVRGIFSQAVGGVSYDESVRLEPTQLAGFSQSFRSLISESLAGSVEAPVYQIAGVALDFRPGTNTWLSLQTEALEQEATRDFGIFDLNFTPPPGFPVGSPANTREHLDYHEWHARVVLNQIVGREWFLQAQYQFTRSELESSLPTISATPGFDRTTTSSANLHQAGLAAMWRSPGGFFSRGEFWWFAQQLGGEGPQPSGDSFPQLNFYVGYRFPKRRAELTVGVLNLTDQDYRLSPLNYYLEMPRERVLYLRLQLNF